MGCSIPEDGANHAEKVIVIMSIGFAMNPKQQVMSWAGTAWLENLAGIKFWRIAPYDPVQKNWWILIWWFVYKLSTSQHGVMSCYAHLKFFFFFNIKQQPNKQHVHIYKTLRR